MRLSATYRFDSATDTTPPPGGGEVRLNAADQAAATTLWASATDASGVDRSAMWGGLSAGAEVILGTHHFVAGGPPQAVTQATYLAVPITMVTAGASLADGELVTAQVEYIPSPPSLDAIRAWVGVPATVLTDEQLGQVVAAELRIQARACTLPADAGGLPTLSPELIQALYRRVGREVAAKGLPLGMLGLEAEFGPTTLSRWDAEIERLEGRSRRVVFG